MGIDIHITILGRKERDSVYPDTTYRALEFWRKDKNRDKFEEKKNGLYPFYFPYFRNSYFFTELRDYTYNNDKWNGILKNIENPEVLQWYNNEENGLWGHSYITMKDISKWIADLEYDNTKLDDCEAISCNEEIIDVLKYIYKTAEFMLILDDTLEDRYDFQYDVDNSIILFAFDN